MEERDPMAQAKAPSAIPSYLDPFIAQQEYEKYTPIDHASWRYIMRVSEAFFRETAHPKYLDGLKETGVSRERIPRLEEMNERLGRFGWQAAAVSGFIPPQVFMEFQSLGIMPIACDMRKHSNISYTPAPDIVHEAAGHAPMVADPDYRAYLRNYGEVSRKAIFSWEDMELYDAIRTLSETKENPQATEMDVQNAERQFEAKAASISYVSEATRLSRMYWWTVEYGLVGELSDPLIYGAGLLSSIGESYHCLSDEVGHIAMGLACVDQEFDITKPQPQLFVTPDFPALNRVLEDFADGMAFRVGGIQALRTAQKARTVTTTVLDSGLQISGVLQEIRVDREDRPFFLRYSSAVQLAEDDRELPGHGMKTHAEGFSSPIGAVKNLGLSAGQLGEQDLARMGFRDGRAGRLEFESGLTVEGRLIEVLRGGKGILLLRFEDCLVTQGAEVLYRPEWGVFDMACGSEVSSVFGGPADRTSYPITRPPRVLPRQKSNFIEAEAELNQLYADVRQMREGEDTREHLAGELGRIAGVLKGSWPGDWLLRLEILELCSLRELKLDFLDGLRVELDELARRKEFSEVIERGLALLGNDAGN